MVAPLSYIYTGARGRSIENLTPYFGLKQPIHGKIGQKYTRQYVTHNRLKLGGGKAALRPSRIA